MFGNMRRKLYDNVGNIIFPMNVLKHYNLAVPVTLKGEQIAQSMAFEFLSQVDTSQVDVSQADVSQVDKSLHI